MVIIIKSLKSKGDFLMTPFYDYTRIKIRKKLYSLINDLEQQRFFLSSISDFNSGSINADIFDIECKIILEKIFNFLHDDQLFIDFFELENIKPGSSEIETYRTQLVKILIEDAYSYSWFVEYMTGEKQNIELSKNRRFIITSEVIQMYILYCKFINMDNTGYIVTRMEDKGALIDLYRNDPLAYTEDLRVERLSKEKVILFEILTQVTLHMQNHYNGDVSDLFEKHIISNLHRMWDDSDILKLIEIVQKYLRSYYELVIKNTDCKIELTEEKTRLLASVLTEDAPALINKFKSDVYFSKIIIAFLYECNIAIEKGCFSIDNQLQIDGLTLNMDFSLNIKTIINIIDKYQDNFDKLFEIFSVNQSFCNMIYIGLNLSDFSFNNTYDIDISNRKKFITSFSCDRTFFFIMISGFYNLYKNFNKKVLTIKI